jgi:Ca2+-binding EF-hand superfamily protein
MQILSVLQECHTLFDALDSNQDGGIDYNEMLQAIRVRCLYILAVSMLTYSCFTGSNEQQAPQFGVASI